jgi:hypothetical protein
LVGWIAFEDCNAKTYELFMSTNVYKRFDPRVRGERGTYRNQQWVTDDGSLNTDLGRLLTQFLSSWIRPCTRDLIVLTQFDKYLTQDLGLLLSLSTFWHNLQQHP